MTSHLNGEVSVSITAPGSYVKRLKLGERAPGILCFSNKRSNPSYHCRACFYIWMIPYQPFEWPASDFFRFLGAGPRDGNSELLRPGGEARQVHGKHVGHGVQAVGRNGTGGGHREGPREDDVGGASLLRAGRPTEARTQPDGDDHGIQGAPMEGDGAVSTIGVAPDANDPPCPRRGDCGPSRTRVGDRSSSLDPPRAIQGVPSTVSYGLYRLVDGVRPFRDAERPDLLSGGIGGGSCTRPSANDIS